MTTTTKSDDRYAVQWMPICKIRPSPENDILYGKVDSDTDPSFAPLLDSIERKGLEEPLILTGDNYVLSGHRRLAACKHLGMERVPVRIKGNIVREGNNDFMRELADYNPQRVKGPAALFREMLLRFKTEEEAIAAISKWDEERSETNAVYTDVFGTKDIEHISKNKMEFLRAVQAVVERLEPFWPLTLRQIHYQLLNDPPLTLTPRRSKFNVEKKYRYRNDPRFYDKLVALCVPARYRGFIPWSAIDDPTRPHFSRYGFESVQEFMQQETENFLTGYHRNRQQDQPHHIEVFGEKNTLIQIMKPVCQEYYVPLTIGRGCCSHPVWRDMAGRFQASGKKEFILIAASDLDPAGLILADDAIRSLRNWGIEARYHRLGVTPEQISVLNLSADFNPAKEEGAKLATFIQQTGSAKTWELEALPPEYLQEQLRQAIRSNMDIGTYKRIVDQEKKDCGDILKVRSQFAAAMGNTNEGGTT